jgi:hypothetical protein
VTAPARWSELETAAPELATAGHDLLYQYGPGLAYLATLRGDGAPRLHPVCPVVAAGGLYVFIGNHSPKVHDLRRDGRYSLHTFPRQDVDDEFCVSGVAVDAEGTGVRDAVYAAYVATGATTSNDTLFELLIDRALHAQYEARPSWPPVYRRWPAS